MKTFDKIIPNRIQCQQELKEFGSLLSSKDELGELGDLLPFFRKRKQLTALIGSCFHPGITTADLIAHEFDLDDYYCDLVVGESRKCAYLFIEFEDAKRDSIFLPKTDQRFMPEWSKRFEHGFSQIVDWAHKLYDIEKSVDTFETRFGCRIIDAMNILVIGRSSFLSAPERVRLNWRWKHVIVNSQQARCITYDQLFEEMEYAITTYAAAVQLEHTMDVGTRFHVSS
jgi:hypothetical protein